MAKQHGITPFTGKLGEVVGRKLNGIFIFSRPGGFTPESLEAGKDNIYKEVFNNANEFGRASLMATAIYGTIDRKEFAANINGKAHETLVGILRTSAKYDRTHPKGKRKPNETAIMQLVGYSLNPPADNTIPRKLKIEETDETTLTITLNHGVDQFQWHEAAHAIQLFFYTTQIDFQNQTAPNPAFHYQEMHLDDIEVNHQIQIPTLPGNCLLFIGARFLEEVNGNYYLLNNKTHSPLYIGHYRTSNDQS